MVADLKHVKLYADKVKGVKEMSKVPPNVRIVTQLSLSLTMTYY